MKSRRYFASANTSSNFVNHFNCICNQTKKYFRYIIKGGSGTGKSTLMKKIATYFSKKGEEIEYFHCSADPHSLDGVRIVSANICILDGTSPHVTEATLPMVTDKIINVGDFIGEEVAKYEKELKSKINKKKKEYQIIYNYLASAGLIYKNNLIIEENENCDYSLYVNKVLNGIKYTANVGYNRDLFISSLDSNGIINFIDKNKYTRKTILPLNSYYGQIALKEIQEKIILSGNDCISFYNILDANNLESLYIPCKDEIIIFNKEEINPIVRVNNEKINEILMLAGKSIANARKLHKELEKYYIESLNFKMLDNLYEELKQEIEKRINKT